MAGLTFLHGDDDNTITAEQHALDNPGHQVIVVFDMLETGHGVLKLDCVTPSCEWWDETIF